MQNGIQRLLGVLVIFQALAPFLIITILLGSFVKLGCDVGDAVTSNWIKTKEHIKDANTYIKDIEKEGKRIMDEVKAIKGAAKDFSGDLGKAVKPLRKALLGLQSSMKLVAGSIESVINGIVKVVNKLPRVNLEPLNLQKHLKIKAFSIDLPEIDLNISPDFKAVQALAVVSSDIADDAEQSLVEVVDAFRFWWTLIQWLFALIVLWVILALVGYAARLYTKIEKGLRLMKGESVNEALHLL